MNKKELTITKEKVLKAANECPDAKRILETLFPEVFAKPDYTVKIEALRYFLCIRTGGNLKDRSFYLDDYTYNWALVTDDTGQLCLQPTYKKNPND